MTVRSSKQSHSIRGFLRELDRELRSQPRIRRREIRGYVTEHLAEFADAPPAEVDRAISSLGSPSEIVDAWAEDSDPLGQARGGLGILLVFAGVVGVVASLAHPVAGMVVSLVVGVATIVVRKRLSAAGLVLSASLAAAGVFVGILYLLFLMPVHTVVTTR